MKNVKARFHRRALIIVVGALVAFALIAYIGGMVLETTGRSSPLLAFLPAIAALLLLGGLCAPAVWNGIGLRVIAKKHPDGVLFLARQQPYGTPDLPTYLYRNDIHVDVTDRWMPGLVDHRGISAWSGGPRARQILLMSWSELGEIKAVDFTTNDGRERYGIAVDVVPYEHPLIVIVGYARFGVQTTFDARGTRAVVAAANAVREPSRTTGS